MCHMYWSLLPDEVLESQLKEEESKPKSWLKNHSSMKRLAVLYLHNPCSHKGENSVILKIDLKGLWRTHHSSSEDIVPCPSSADRWSGPSKFDQDLLISKLNRDLLSLLQSRSIRAQTSWNMFTDLVQQDPYIFIYSLSGWNQWVNSADIAYK